MAGPQGRTPVLGERSHQPDHATRDGELVGFAKITRDLTERRAAEERLQPVTENGKHRPAHWRRRA